MKISGQDPTLVNAYLRTLNTPAQPSDTASGGGNAPTTSTPTEETVVISEAARAIQGASGSMTDMEEVRTEKVEALKSQVESGTYQVDPQKVAEKMIRESLLNDLL